MRKQLHFILLGIVLLLPFFLNSCASSGGVSTAFGGPMGGPTKAIRAAKIANEPRGKFFYGRRYYVKNTRFWGYLRKPGQNANNSKLVIFNESKKRNPDRFSENGPPGKRYAYDQNYEYRINGYYTGEKAYEINTNQFLPEFMLTGYELISEKPGWLFSPEDKYNPQSVTLKPRY